MQQLRPPGFISIIAIQGSFIMNESYVSLYNSDKLIGNETLIRLSHHSWNDITMVFADMVYLITGLDIVDLIPGGTSSKVMGMAYTQQVCSRWKVAVGEDQPGNFSGVHTAAHEIGHLLGSWHDGQSISTPCLAKDGYLMSPIAGGRNSYTFSNCSIVAITTFLRTRDAYCLRRNNNNRLVRLPSFFEKLPGDVMNGRDFCKQHFPKHPDVMYVKRPSHLPPLNEITERVLSPCIRVQRLVHDGRFGIVGHIVIVPVDVEEMVCSLRRDVVVLGTRGGDASDSNGSR
ncbi:venom metalloproteinase antarease-like TpachMP_B [Dermacentor silvarum]|uniref:venom metalloproteinase antarease-like TpachMP_B n=1 Tax=Dermacentor silvarum TaxID=543639 RepID=UPI0021008EE7|nr:venom metalloproteinase antarease-like TpachMP_B [Dermacentor silvarum]